MEIDSSLILSALKYICRVPCFSKPHQIKGKRICYKGCDPVCILCYKNAKFIAYAYYCYQCQFPFCIFHYQQHIRANTEFKGFNCINGDLSKISQAREQDVPKMIMHLRAKEVEVGKINTLACVKCVGKLLSISTIIESLGMCIT